VRPEQQCRGAGGLGVVGKNLQMFAQQSFAALLPSCRRPNGHDGEIQDPAKTQKSERLDGRRSPRCSRQFLLAALRRLPQLALSPWPL
jgi:hypothetical protein